MIERGYKLKDLGAHTAIISNCPSCGENKLILPFCHWINSGKQDKGDNDGR
jgi:hypothetical protein